MTRAQATAAAIHKALPEIYMFGNHYWNGAKVTSVYRLVMSNLFMNIFCISFAKHMLYVDCSVQETNDYYLSFFECKYCPEEPISGFWIFSNFFSFIQNAHIFW